MTSPDQTKDAEVYGDKFYEFQMDGSYRSARKYVDFLFSVFAPRNVVDVGCGRGTWLKAFKENGTEKAVGLDGSWNSQANMIDQSIVYRGTDLNKPIELPNNERFDLAISLEVAEHLQESSAQIFVKSLTELSDVIMFGAAYTQQGGDNHINEQPHTYWAHMFKNSGYSVFDLFRPVFWGDPDVEFWYQQNTFLYVKNGCPLIEKLAGKGFHPLANIAFLDCVHPSLYSSKLALTADKILAYTKMLVDQYPQFAENIQQILATSKSRQ